MFLLPLGLLLAILEHAGVISPLFSEEGHVEQTAGTVAAGYQNFIICIEMFFAAIALRFAFPYDLYAQQEVVTHGRTVSLQSISSNLKVKGLVKAVVLVVLFSFFCGGEEGGGSVIPQATMISSGSLPPDYAKAQGEIM